MKYIATFVTTVEFDGLPSHEDKKAVAEAILAGVQAFTLDDTDQKVTSIDISAKGTDIEVGTTRE